MLRALLRIWLVIGVFFMLSACEPKNPRLMHIRSATEGPDEFGILPTKPLEQPKSYAELPPPTPGAPNRTDPTPEADAVAALGGNPKLLGRQGIPGSDQGVVAYATRFGVAPGIRQTLAVEDLEYRRKNDGRLLERLFALNVYFKAYRPYSLNKYAELERWRRAGVRTVAAPPEIEK